MNNSEFFNVLKRSFEKYLETGARSNKKLEILHGAISRDLYEKLKDKNDTNDHYSVASLGFGKEGKIAGRYIDKFVDITIYKNHEPIAGVAVKFVMGNYKQNSNNYFENMLGETVNIRCGNIPYFQIFIVPDSLPYFNKSGSITGWEQINAHDLKKYVALSKDNIDTYLHTPNKTLVSIISISPSAATNKIEYIEYYQNNHFSITASPKHFDFGAAIIYNDYEMFIKKVVHTVLSQ